VRSELARGTKFSKKRMKLMTKPMRKHSEVMAMVGRRKWNVGEKRVR
jgi:hypothetical protein